MRAVLLAAVVLIAISSFATVAAQAQADAPDSTLLRLPPEWKPISFLAGDWEGTGAAPGVTNGTFSLHPDLDGTIMLRRSEAATTSGGMHKDLMVLYATRTGALRAFYVDNEEHVINYTVTPITDPVQGAMFLSDEVAKQPRFRLTYTVVDPKTIKAVFEFQKPGATDWTIIVEGSAKRK